LGSASACPSPCQFLRSPLGRQWCIRRRRLFTPRPLIARRRRWLIRPLIAHLPWFTRQHRPFTSASVTDGVGPFTAEGGTAIGVTVGMVDGIGAGTEGGIIVAMTAAMPVVVGTGNPG